MDQCVYAHILDLQNGAVVFGGSRMVCRARTKYLNAYLDSESACSLEAEAIETDPDAIPFARYLLEEIISELHRAVPTAANRDQLGRCEELIMYEAEHGAELDIDMLLDLIEGGINRSRGAAM